MRHQKGITLIEMLVSLTLIAMIAMPFLSLFIQSAKGRQTSKDILHASYAAMNQMEKLVGMNCKEICLSNGEFRKGDFLIKIMSKPWTDQEKPCFYFIFQDNGYAGYDCIIIPPDGKDGIFLDILHEFIDVQVIIDKDEYQIYADTHRVTGKMEDGEKPVMIVNGAHKPEDLRINLNIEGDADVIVYSGQEEINIEWEGTPVVNKNIYYRDYTLFRSVVEVYDAEKTDKMLSSVESILRIPN